MRVLVGCEESKKVSDAFRQRGHDGWSNDILPARNGRMDNHLQMCMTKAITQHGPWDIIILHYECTEMAVCANRWYAEGKPDYAKRLAALDFAERLWNLAKKYARKGACFENPASTLWTRIGTPQYIQPWQFGHGETKKTGLKLDRLPELWPTKIVPERESIAYGRCRPARTESATEAKRIRVSPMQWPFSGVAYELV